ARSGPAPSILVLMSEAAALAAGRSMQTPLHNRRQVMLGVSSLAALALAGCTTTTPARTVAVSPPPPVVPPEILAMYAALPTERFPIPAARIDLVDPIYWRQEVENVTGEKPGTVVVDT